MLVMRMRTVDPEVVVDAKVAVEEIAETEDDGSKTKVTRISRMTIARLDS
jgi:hypothetical protein